MNIKTLNRIIPIVSCGVTFLWGMLGNAWNISWLAVLIGGCAMAIVAIIKIKKKITIKTIRLKRINNNTKQTKNQS